MWIRIRNTAKVYVWVYIMYTINCKTTALGKLKDVMKECPRFSYFLPGQRIRIWIHSGKNLPQKGKKGNNFTFEESERPFKGLGRHT